MFPNSSSGLSLVKILNGVSKSLNIAKEVVPIYKQVKPIASKTIDFVNQHKLKTPTKKRTNIKLVTEKSINNPSFFM